MGFIFATQNVFVGLCLRTLCSPVANFADARRYAPRNDGFGEVSREIMRFYNEV